MRQLSLPPIGSLFTERLAVGALIDSGILLVGAHEDPVQRAVVLGVAMMSALLDSAFNALVGVAVHSCSSFFVSSKIV